MVRTDGGGQHSANTFLVHQPVDQRLNALVEMEDLPPTAYDYSSWYFTTFPWFMQVLHIP